MGCTTSLFGSSFVCADGIDVVIGNQPCYRRWSLHGCSSCWRWIIGSPLVTCGHIILFDAYFLLLFLFPFPSCGHFPLISVNPVKRLLQWRKVQQNIQNSVLGSILGIFKKKSWKLFTRESANSSMCYIFIFSFTPSFFDQVFSKLAV